MKPAHTAPRAVPFHAMRMVGVFLLAGASIGGCGEDRPVEPVQGGVSAPHSPSPNPPTGNTPPEEQAEATSQPTGESNAPVEPLPIPAGQALREGRRLAHQGAHEQALALFHQGLRTDGDNPTLLCEAGWAAFHARHPDAETLLQDGVALHTDPQRRASCLYSLGRLAERQQNEAPAEDTDVRESAHRRALDAYAQSLALRPDNEQTAQRYEALAGHPYTAYCPPPGPYDDVAAFCAQLHRRAESLDRHPPLRCEGTALHPEHTPATPSSPALQHVEVAWSPYERLEHYLLIGGESGFVAAALLGSSETRSCANHQYTLTSASWRRLSPDPSSPLPPPTDEQATPRWALHLMGTLRRMDGCGLSPWDACMQNAEDPTECDALDDEANIEEHTRATHLFCLPQGDADERRYRCSYGADLSDPMQETPAPIQPSVDPLAPLPPESVLSPLLRCPPSHDQTMATPQGTEEVTTVTVPTTAP